MLTQQQLSSFVDAIKKSGIPSPITIPEFSFESITRCKAFGDKKTNLTFCIYENNGNPGGWFHHFKTGIGGTWIYNRDDKNKTSEISFEMMKKRDEIIAKAKAKAVQRADIARDIYQASSTDLDYIRKHQYLINKKISPFAKSLRRISKIDANLFFDKTDSKTNAINDCLVIPIKNSKDSIISVQIILPDGKKFFLSGAKAQGGFHELQSNSDSNVICICEGYATAQSVNQVTDATCIIAFASGQIPAVAKAIRKKYQNHNILIASDNDEHEAGLKAANKCAEFNCVPWIPEFTEGQSGTDWNDYWILNGDDAVLNSFNDKLNWLNSPVTDSVADHNTLMIPEMFPDVNAKMTVKGTKENLEALLKFYGLSARFNKISKRTEITIPWTTFSLENENEASLAEVKSLAVRNEMPYSLIGDYLVSIGDANAYNPVLDWVLSKPWDGIDRLYDLQNTLIVIDDDVSLRDMLVRKWCIGAIKLLAQDELDMVRNVLVLQCEQQNIGKTQWFANLLPKFLRKNYFKEGLVLDPANKDSVLIAISSWIAELGEIDSTFKKDLSRLKSFISMDKDVVRRPFGKASSDFQRRTVFCGTVNQSKFLKDDTGNSRFWVIKCLSVIANHQIDMQQFWRQMYEIWKTGEICWLDDEYRLMLDESNKQHQEIEPIEELIDTYYDFDSNNFLTIEGRWMTSTDVMREIGVKQETRANATKVGAILSSIEGVKKKRTHTGTKYRMPYLKEQYQIYKDSESIGDYENEF